MIRSLLCLFLLGGMAVVSGAVADMLAPLSFRINIYYSSPLPPRPSPRVMIPAGRFKALKAMDCRTSRARGGNPLAETALQRGTLILKLDDAQRRLHAAAQLSQEPAAAADILAPELDSNEPTRAFAAALTLAFVVAKADPSLQGRHAQMALQRLEQAATRSGRRCSDCAYLNALRAWSGRDPRTAQRLAASALAIEPHYFNALALNTILSIDLLDGPAGKHKGTCTSALTDLMATLLSLAELNPCPLQAGHLDLLVSRQLERPDEHAAIQAMRFVIAEIARNRPAADTAYAALGGTQDLHPSCKRQLSKEIRELVLLRKEQSL